jgi:hypothetical protein
MADEKPSLHIDDDWKKQAQEEKRRLAEQQQKAAAAPPAPRGAPGGMAIGPGMAPAMAPGAAPGDPRAGPSGPGMSPSPAGPAVRPGARGARQLPEASFATLVQSLLTQALFYLGELSPYGGEPVLNLDMARHQVDMLGILEQKTANNLNEDEKRLLDAALYDVRNRFVQVASQFIQ